ncbi:MAG: ribonuclease III [Cucumibacter sp.]
MKRAKPDRSALEAALGHSFADRALLERALTHTSAIAPSKRVAQSYQRLEFLGDRVLGLVVAEVVFAAFQSATEGDLSKILHVAVSKQSCSVVARELGLGRYIRLGASEARTGGAEKDAILADALEGLIGAIYLDGGLEAARRFIGEEFAGWLSGGVPDRGDAKTTLQEWAQSQGLEPPAYDQKARMGPDHAPEFTIEVSLPGYTPLTAQGRSKKHAENAAAREFLLREKVWKRAP